MVKRFFVRLIFSIIILIICMPLITQVLDQFNSIISPIGYELGVDVSARRLVKNPMGAVKEFMDSALDTDRLFNFIGEY